MVTPLGKLRLKVSHLNLRLLVSHTVHLSPIRLAVILRNAIMTSIYMGPVISTLAGLELVAFLNFGWLCFGGH